MKKSHQLASLVIPSPSRNSPRSTTRPTPRPSSPTNEVKLDVDVVKVSVVRSPTPSKEVVVGDTRPVSRSPTPQLALEVDNDPFADPASAQRAVSPIAKSPPPPNSSPSASRHEAPSTKQPTPAFIAPAPVASKAKRNLVEESMAMQAQLLAPLGGAGTTNGQRRTRVTRKRVCPSLLSRSD